MVTVLVCDVLKLKITSYIRYSMIGSLHSKYIRQLKTKKQKTKQKKTNANNRNSVLEDSTALPSLDSYLLTEVAVMSKLLLKTWHTIIATLFGDQRLGSYWLSAVLTHKAGFMPVIALKFHFPRT
jgi:hypothetical protein